MIRITIELLPFGSEERKKVIGKAEIWNTGEGTLSSGNYGYKIWGKRKVIREGRLDGFPRRRLLVWDLLYRVLREEFSSRNKEKSGI